MTRQVKLLVNDQPIELDYFVQGFIDHTIAGMLESLEGTGRIKSANIAIERDKTTVKVNENLVPTNPFVGKIIRNAIVGIVSSLKGVGNIDKVSINIKR
jgi:hypothetical protein